MNSTSEKPTSPGESSFCHPGAHETFDLDALLRALASPYRREVLCLLDAEPEWSFEDLAASVGEVEAVPWTTSGTKAATVLYHHHLPVLARADLVEGDESYRRIRRGENFEAVKAMVDAAVAVLP